MSDYSSSPRDHDNSLFSAAASSTAVAIDRDKNSQQAVKWAIDHLVVNTTNIVLVHVKTPAATAQGYGRSEGGSGSESDVAGLFRSYRLFCARKGMKVTEVILEDGDVTKTLIQFISSHQITNIVVGASNRNALTRKFRNADVPTALLKLAPDFCAVYVIWKGRTLSVRSAKTQAPNSVPVTPRPSLSVPASPRLPSTGAMESEESVRSPFTRGGWRAPIPSSPAMPERPSFDRNIDYMKTASRDNKPLSKLIDTPDTPTRPPRSSTSRDFVSDDLDLPGSMSSSFQSSDFSDSYEFSSISNNSSMSSRSGMENRDLEAEMKRLKLELKQTMDMYSTACKEAITAKQKARELHQWKMEEARRFEEARQAEEAALAMVEMEKARCKAAIEAAQAAQRIAELEAKKRLNAEQAAKRESEEKKKALEALAHNDVRYRKYSIEEIEIATDYFADALKIGEGGYGPVYKAHLDHTPVAIKVLRPDAAQGRKQFQQEVEVLSCIRHPNMVLLLGACPEYGCLVYEHMENGSLDDRLFCRGDTPPIPWSVRFKIAAEITTGLLFLHQSKPEPLVHRDLKPANILLDRNYNGKISDVGLARLVPPSVADSVTQYRMTSTAGTFCYIDPEYQQTGMLGIKSDIYSLGILLLQIITAKPPMGLTHYVERAIDKGTFEEMLDTAVPDWPVEEALSFAKLSLKCAELRRKDRPDLGRVILPELNRLRMLAQEWEASNGGSGGGCFGSTSRSSYHNLPPRPWSHIAQDRGRSSTQTGLPWKSTTDAGKAAGVGSSGS